MLYECFIDDFRVICAGCRFEVPDKSITIALSETLTNCSSCRKRSTTPMSRRPSTWTVLTSYFMIPIV